MTTTPVMPPPPSPTVAQLRRSTGDRMVAGVCGGIGRRYGVDPVVLRVIFVVAIFAAGVGLLLYLALWLLLPTDTDPTPGPLTGNVLGLIVGVLVGVGTVAATFGWVGSLGILPGLLVATLLVGMAVWLLQQREARPMPAGTVLSAPAPDWAPPTGFAYGGTGAATEQQGWYPAAPPPPPPPREHSYLGLITLLAALVVGTGLAAAAAAGIGSITIVTVLAAMLAVLAIGLLVGAAAGRARWLIALALPLALFLGAVAHIAPIVTGGVPEGIGQRTWTPTGPGSYELGIGEATLDLTTWAAAPLRRQPSGETVSARLGVGELVVLVPESWDVTIVAEAGVGEITLDGARVGDPGPNERADLTLAAAGVATGSLRLDLGVRAGEITIKRRPAAPVSVPEQRQAPSQDQDRTSGSADRADTATTKENAR